MIIPGFFQFYPRIFPRFLHRFLPDFFRDFFKDYSRELHQCIPKIPPGISAFISLGVLSGASFSIFRPVRIHPRIPSSITLGIPPAFPLGIPSGISSGIFSDIPTGVSSLGPSGIFFIDFYLVSCRVSSHDSFGGFSRIFPEISSVIPLKNYSGISLQISSRLLI